MALPEGQDPDDFVNRHGAEGFLERVRLASPMFDFYLEQKLTKASIEAEGNQLVYYIRRKRTKPDQMMTFIEDAGELVRMFDVGK